MKDRVARDSEECRPDLKRTKTNAAKQCRAKMRHAIAHSEEDIIGSITSTVSRNVRADLETFIKIS